MRGGGPVGLALALTLALWALLAHPGGTGGLAMVAMIAVAVVAWTGGAVLGRVSATWTVVGVAVVAAVAVLSGAPASLTGSPTAGPLGYSNANAALLSAGVAGVVGVAARATGILRRSLLGGGIVLMALSTATESRAATVICVVVLLLGLVVGRGQDAPWQVLSAVVVTATFAATVLLGAGDQPGARAEVVENTVGGTRTALWGDALRLANEHPARGIGPGEFASRSPTASEDPGPRSAHSTPLQVAAELGWTGWLLLAGLVGWLIVVLGRSSILFAVLAPQPMIDYTLHFPLVVALGAVTLAALSALPDSGPDRA